MLEFLTNFLGTDFVKELKNDILEYKSLNLEQDDILDNIKDYSDFIIMAMYLLAMDMKEYDVAYMIKRCSQKIVMKRKEEFVEAVKEGKEEKFFKNINKVDVVNLAMAMNLYGLDKKEYNKLSKKDKMYYNVLNNYLK